MRVRFAPSPTGSLHVGGARTALYNYLLARHNKGTFIVRIEDTDKERNIPEATTELLQDLTWLGLDWDEGPKASEEVVGTRGPYFQSQRDAIYQQYAEQLIVQGLAYYCFMQEEELQEIKEAHAAYQVHSPYRDMSLEEARERLKKEPATVRVRVPKQENYTFNDALRGPIVLPSSMVNDFVILRSCGTPVYNFCCVVDDHLMGITHVLRGEEHLSNTLKQLILYNVLQFTPPLFAHLSVIVGEDRKKLSKRQASVSVKDFREQGFLPEAMINFLVLLGWSHPDGRDIISIETMTETFDLDRVHTSAAFFDVVRLRWMNAQYLREKSALETRKLLQDFNGMVLPMPDKVFEAFWALYASDCETLVDVHHRYHGLYTWSISEAIPEYLENFSLKDIWGAWRNGLAKSDTTWTNVEEIKACIKQCQEVSGSKGPALYMPLRYAVLGTKDGADVSLVSCLIPRHVLLERVDSLLMKLGMFHEK